MGELIYAVGKNFERLLRWIYPGALFLVLLGMSKPDAFDHLAKLDDGIGLWGLVIVGLVGGVVTYLVQGYVVGFALAIIFNLLRWDVNQGLQVDVFAWSTRPRCCPRGVERFFDRMAKATVNRQGGSVTESLGNYLNYAHGTYHAILITGWLTVVFYGINEQGSVFSNISAWAVLPPAILLMLGGILWFAILTRIPFSKKTS
jgi:hypothetical protein